VVGVAVGNAVLGMALGLFVSAFARSEFQAVQFMPVIVLPQFLTCGLLIARDQMAGWLEAISNVLPMSYAVDALQEIGAQAEVTGTLVRDLAIVFGATVVALGLGALTLRRRSG
jgi:ABC-2 type transport system permease protein